VAAGSGNDTLSGAGLTTGNIYIDASRASGPETLIGGSGSAASTLVGSQTASNAFYLSTAANLGSDSVYGNLTRTDTLSFTSGNQAINDADLTGTRLRSIEVISLTGANNTVRLGANAQAGGISTLIGGTGSDYLSAEGMTAGNIVIDGSSGSAGDTLAAGSGSSKSTLIGNASSGANNYFRVSGSQALASTSIVASAASTDVILVTTGAQNITDAAFTKSSGGGLDALILTGGNNNVALGAVAENSFLNPSNSFSITGGTQGGDKIDISGVANLTTFVDESRSTGNNTLVASSGGSTLIGGSSANSSNLFIANSSQILGKASIVGGGGIDTLQITGNAQNITSFSRVAETEILQINGRSNVINLTGADLAGISTLIGTGSSNSVDGSNYTTSPDSLTFDFSSSTGRDTLIGGGTGNIFQIKDRTNLLNSSITGGGFAQAQNTLQLVTGGQTIGDTDFTSAGFIGKLVLGTAATGNSVVLGNIAGGTTGISTIISGKGRDTIDAASLGNRIWIDGSQGSGDSLVGSTLAGAFNTLIGSTNGTNVFVVAGISGNSIVGGAAGNDTLAFTSSISVEDSSFAQLSDIGALKFLEGNNSVILGSNALIAGISTVIGGLNGDTGGDTFDASGYNNASILFQVTDQNYLSTSSIVGSSGSTTLQFTNDGISVTDADLATIRNIKVLQTANGDNHILISDNFQSQAGIVTIIGGTGSDTINIADSDRYNPSIGSSTLTYDLSRGKNGYDFVTSIANTQYSKIIGGSGKNTLEIADAGAIGDSLFANQYQAKAGSLILSDAGSNSATLAGMAGAAGISNVYLGNVGDSINATSFLGNLTIQGGSGNDLVQTSMTQGSNVILQGGHLGTDTLQVVYSSGRSIKSLAGSFDALALSSGNNSVQLTEAQSAGITSIYGGTGADTISVENFTKGIDLIVAQTALGSDSSKASLAGGNGNDTLTIAEFPSPPSSPVINEATFARTSSIEALALNSTGGYSATFGVNALKTGISTIYGSTGGNDYFNATNFIDPNGVIKKGLKFVLPGSQQLSTDTIQGTIYNDTLALASGSQTVDDSKFANVSGIESFQLGDGGNSVALDTNAKNAGITAVIGGSGNNSITQGDNFTTTATISGGGGNDTLSITDRASLRRNSLDGGSGTNTIVFSKDGQTIADADFGRTSSIQAIRTANGSNVVTLGSTAGARGISSLFGGTGNDSFDASALGTPTYLDGGAGNNTFIGGTTVVGGAGNDSIVVTADAASITGSGGNDLISFNSYANIINSRLVDGGMGTDTLAIGSAVTLNDSLSNFTNIEALALASSSVVTLGHNAQSAGINQIILGTGPDTIDAKTYTAQLTLDASSYSGASSLGDSLIGGTSGTNFIFSRATAVLNSTVKGGAGTDTLAFSSGGQNVTDNNFTFLSSVEALSLSGSSNTATVNLTAQGAGLRSVSLGGGGDTFTQESPFTNALSVIGGAGADNIVLATAAQLANNTISDGGGKDTLTIQEASSFQTSDFTKVSDIEALKLTSNSSITLGGAISFESILGGTGLDTFVQTSSLIKSSTLDGGSGEDLFSLQSASYLSSESLLGGDGTDTLAIASAVTGFDDSFTGIKSMEVLSLSSAADSIILRGKAILAGIKKVLLGDGNNSLTVDTKDNFLSYNSIQGGSGTDTLTILGQVSLLADTGFSSLSSVDVLDISKSGAANSVTLGEIASSLTGANIKTLVSGSGNDLIAIQSQNQFGGGYSLIGGDGTDTLSILGQVTGLNDGFGNVRSFEALSLCGADDNMTFGSAAQSAGIGSVSLGSGSNKISFTTQDIYGGTSVTGGSGSDTLALLGLGVSPINLEDSDFANLTSIDAIDLSQTGSASHVALGSTAENEASISTIVGSSNADTITASEYQGAIIINDSLNISAAASLTGGKGDDLIILGGQGALNLSSIDGNNGTNTLSIIDQIAGNDSALFTNLSQIQVLSLSGSDDTATLGTKASLAGISTVVAGGGNDNIAFATQDYFTTASLDGGAGTDTVAIAGPVSLNDAFNRLSSVEVLDISSILGLGESNKVTLGDHADDQSVGLRKVISGAGNDSFAVANQNQFSHDTIVGGGGTDTLAILDQVTGLNDSGFANLSSIEVLDLSASGLSNSLTLGTTAKNTAGIQTIISGSGDDLINVKSQTQIGENYSVDGGWGTDTLQIQDQVNIEANGFANVHGIEVLSLGGATNKVTLDSSAAGIISVVGGNSSDRIAFDTKARFSAASVVGGAGTDTLAILSPAAVTFAAGDLAKISSIEVLDLSATTGNDSVTLDAAALTNGINNVIGGSGADWIDASAHTTDTRLTLNGGAGLPNTLIGGSGTEFFLGHSGDSIVGGGGNDTLTTNDSVYTVNPGANIKNIFYTGSGTISLTGNNDGDALNGGSLNDTIVGGTGNDSIDGGAGADSLVGGAGDDLYFVDNAGDKVIEASGALGGFDTVIANINNYSLATNVEVLTLGSAASIKSGYGNNQGNTILGNDNGNTLYGGTGNDSILGGSGDDTIIGGGGSDYLDGKGGRNSLIGAGTGNDTFVIDVAPDNGLNNVYSLRSNDTISINPNKGAANYDALIVNESFSLADAPPLPIGVNQPNPYAGIEELIYDGSNTNKVITLIGNSARNTIRGGSEKDFIIGGAGYDTMIGGQGNDTYLFEDLGDVVFEDSLPSGGIDQINGALVDVSLAAESGVENISLTGERSIGASGGDLNNLLVGNDSSNALRGNGGNDTLLGKDGNDLIDGGSGADSLVGGQGNDTYILDTVITTDGSVISPDTLIEIDNGGIDEIRVAASVDLSQLTHFENVTLLESGLPQGFNDFQVLGNASFNVIKGNSGNNLLDGAGGDDTLIGGAGNDTYRIDSQGDIVFEGIDHGGSGNDLVISTLDRYTLTESVENLQLIGGAGSVGIGNISANTLLGNASDNSLVGLGGSDTILAGQGNDTLDGGFDQRLWTQTTDSMVGGGGNDYYVVDNAGDVVLETADGGEDTILLYPTTRAFEWSWTGTYQINQNSFSTKPATTLNPPLSYTLEFYLNQLIPTPTPLIENQFSYKRDYYYILPDNIENLIAKTRSIVVNNGNFLIGANYIYGNSSNNLISATSDLVGGADIGFNDYFDGQGGIDTMAGGLGNDTYVVDSEDDRVLESAGEGTDLVLASVSYHLDTANIVDSATGTEITTVENLTLLDAAESTDTGSPVSTSITNLNIDGWGNNGNNYLIGNSGNNSLYGEDGNDTLEGKSGTDSLIGGNGNDVYIISDSDDIIQEETGEGSDSVITTSNYILPDNLENIAYTGTGLASLIGNNDANSLIGNIFTQTLIGEGGIDTLDGKDGGDSLIGGENDDTYYVYSDKDTIFESVSEGTDLVYSTASYVLSSNVENLVLTGITGSEALNATGNDLDNSITGNSGNNSLTGLAGNDTILGGLGDDSMDGGSGNNTLIGGDGNDYYFTNGGTDTFVELANEGLDYVVSSSNVDLGDYAYIENIMLTGSSDLNAIGSNVDNKIIGNTGNNTLDGKDGNDLLVIDDAIVLSQSSIVGGNGNDTLSFSKDGLSITDDVLSVITTTSSIEALQTGNGTNYLNLGTNSGNSNISSIFGGTGNDTVDITDLTSQIYLNSGAGNDSLIASVSSLPKSSSDTINGGAGTDTLFLGATTIVDSDLDQLTNVEVLKSSDSSSDFTLGINAMASGISVVFGGAGSDTLDVSAYTTLVNLNAGSGGDLIKLYTGAMLQSTFINGGSGNDTLEFIKNAVSVTDADFINPRVLSLEVIKTASGNNRMILGPNAQSSGITTLVGNNGNDTFDASAYTVSINMDGGSGDNSLVGGAGNDTITSGGGADAIRAGSGTDLIRVANVTALNNLATLDGGAGDDTLAITLISQTIVDDFSNVASVEVLSLAGGINSVILAANAASAKISTLIGGSGNDTFDASNGAYTGTSVYFDGGDGDNSLTGNSGADTLLSGSGNDTLSGGGGNDTLQAWASATTNTASDTLIGGAGADRFVLGDTNGVAYGNGSVALITDFVGDTDYLQLKNWGNAGSDYQVVANAGSGYTHQLFDTHTGGNVLIANINYTGINATTDLTGTINRFL
jgi:Ca2+-binding RTX toxin-like protein